MMSYKLLYISIKTAVNTDVRQQLLLITFKFFYHKTNYIYSSHYADTLTTHLTPNTNHVLQRRMPKVVTCRATRVAAYIFAVDDGLHIATVNKSIHSCTCGKCRSSGIPCRHAIATSTSKNVTDYYEMVPIFLTTEVYRTAYGTEMVYLVPPPQQWEMANEETIVLPP